MVASKNASAHGNYTLSVGSKAQVFHGTAEKTSGGLRKKDIKKNKWGKYVSVKKSAQAAAAYRKNPGVLDNNRANTY